MSFYNLHLSSDTFEHVTASLDYKYPSKIYQQQSRNDAFATKNQKETWQERETKETGLRFSKLFMS